MSKRGRACEACSKIKIKCELGASTGLEPPCERCLRLNKQCVLSQPKRQVVEWDCNNFTDFILIFETQKDRVAELEAQVENLTRLLQAQGIRDPSVINSTPESDVVNPSISEKAQNKKRRIDDASSSSGPNDSPMTSSLVPPETQDLNVTALDEIVDYEAQGQLLEHYLQNQFSVFPLVPITGDCSLESLRAEHLVVLYAVIYAAAPGIISVEKQESVSKILLDHLTNLPFSTGPRTLDVIQAIQITCLYYRSPRHQVQLSVFGLIEVGLKMAARVGPPGPLSPPLNTPASTKDIGIGSIDAWRALLVSHLLDTAMSIFMRRKPHTVWTREQDNCLLQLQVHVADSLSSLKPSSY